MFTLTTIKGVPVGVTDYGDLFAKLPCGCAIYGAEAVDVAGWNVSVSNPQVDLDGGWVADADQCQTKRQFADWVLDWQANFCPCG